MAIGLVHLFEAGLLLMNAAAILNEKRFLKKYGLDTAVATENLGPKNQVATFLHAMRTFMRYPLVAMNVLVIIYEMNSGDALRKRHNAVNIALVDLFLSGAVDREELFQGFE
eukprot:CAMPEP_0197620884 /NCGR_PEP_ID=MMETSP1338-20131121/1596_1 /TAXON_ID=43686 ORGANISM="Pelagodinium beii, Strain RCC1491" /NCGR_SAMPLE_ID=MMETSP1338 /ASSEMBLY_ACC=CAM_ASM_000754 /LENGTH=111 /DNA_ID=CAMNT_0043190183 /DNA_START=45 /DNA_END=381 /DNA_ORIENTATION=+